MKSTEPDTMGVKHRAEELEKFPQGTVMCSQGTVEAPSIILFRNWFQAASLTSFLHQLLKSPHPL